MPDPTSPPRMQRLPAVVGLFFLSPICAEYLIGYAESIGNPLEMLAGLLVLGPLYGAVAVLIREFARRAGRGWPSILLLGGAFGLVQAGLIDQSLFNPEYGGEVDIPYWDAERRPTLVQSLGVSANHVLDFVGGHIIWSFAAPIAVVESCVPGLARRPWLGKPGMAVMVALYLIAAALVFNDHLETEQFTATPTQLAATAAIALLLAVAAFAIPRRSSLAAGWVPHPSFIGLLALAALTVQTLSAPTWSGIALSAAALLLAGALLLHFSGRAAWTQRHVLAAAGAALVVNAAFSFVVAPLGNPSYAMKYISNAAIMLGVLSLLAWAFMRLCRAESAADRVDAGGKS
ncbi:hypothetical protein [Aminobacter sp. BE322]|uniref:hypothetical protein n=1 Tax=unclassified Aminobacter TaxID=2644704 RepID=UPI003D23A22D